MIKRLTIKEQQAIASKSRKMPEPSQELPSQEQQPAAEIESEAANSEDTLRDKQVNVKFTSGDLKRLKKAAGNSHRPVANYIYHTVMDKISGDGY
jgi:predicted DNA binding CopG/RHH family protein